MALTIEGLLRALEARADRRGRAPGPRTPRPATPSCSAASSSPSPWWPGLTHSTDKRVKTVHTIFARGASPECRGGDHRRPDARRSGHGRHAVTISQGDRLCARSLVLLSADEPDFIRHADPAPEGPGSRRRRPPGRSPAGPGRSASPATPTSAHPRQVASTGPGRVQPVHRGAPGRPRCRPGAARLRHRRLPDRHGHASQGRRPVPGPRHPVDRRAEPHAHVPRAGAGGQLVFLPHTASTPVMAAPTAAPTSSPSRASLVASYVQDAMIRPRGDKGPGQL